MTYIRCFNSPVGTIKISSDGENITGIEFAGNGQCSNNDDIPLLVEAEKQFTEYFSHKRKAFSLPLKVSGTDFQKAVWKEISKIPYGKSAAYKDLALALGNPKACRAVGNACGKNPVPIIVPCHRVVSATGEGGFTGGMAIKRLLQETERNN